jgi:hypothetical protein
MFCVLLAVLGEPRITGRQGGQPRQRDGVGGGQRAKGEQGAGLLDVKDVF